MNSGVQCAVMVGALLMLLWSANNWVTQLLEVSTNVAHREKIFEFAAFYVLQVEFHIPILSLVLVLAPSTWMMLLVVQVLISY